jgi:hypothetical protein
MVEAVKAIAVINTFNLKIAKGQQISKIALTYP